MSRATRDAGNFGERVVRERLNANTDGACVDAGESTSVDLYWSRAGLGQMVAIEVKARLAGPVEIQPTPKEERFKLWFTERGHAWALVRVVYKRNGGHTGGGKAPFMATTVEVTYTAAMSRPLARAFRAAIESRGASPV